MINNYQVSRIKEAAIYLRILEKVRPTDIEMTETQFVSDGRQLRWQLPDENNDYGRRDVELEGEEAASLIETLESAESVRVADAAWMLTLIGELQGKPVLARGA